MGTLRQLNPLVHSPLPAQAERQTQQNKGSVVEFKRKEIDMMPGNWAETGNPTPYELSTTIATCKRQLEANYNALRYLDCDREVTLNNIKVLEKLYIILMDYLVD